MLHVCIQTRNKALSVTTLHTMLHLTARAMQNRTMIEVHFVEDRSKIPKLLKTGERIFWLDYGTNLNDQALSKVLDPFPYKLDGIVFPAVREGVEWNQFRTKTLSGSKEPAHQRGLMFDTTVGKKLGPEMYECAKTNARVWVIDGKSVLKKLKGSFDFNTFSDSGIKIGVFTGAEIICHYVHECQGNILEAAGIHLAP